MTEYIQINLIDIIENKAALCKKYLEKERQACFDCNARFAEDYFIDSRDYLLYRHYDCEE